MVILKMVKKCRKTLGEDDGTTVGMGATKMRIMMERRIWVDDGHTAFNYRGHYPKPSRPGRGPHRRNRTHSLGLEHTILLER